MRTDRQARITRVLATLPNGAKTVDRSVVWTNGLIARIDGSLHPGTTPPGTYGAQSQLFDYDPVGRLSSATGYYGALAWTYDANGNRKTETRNGVVSTYSYTANRLASISQTGLGMRSFVHDPAGNIITDTRSGALGLTFEYDPVGRLSKAKRIGSTSALASYGYDAFDRLVSRTVASPASSTLYVHDLADHIIAETDAAGATRREYIWLGDLPVAVIDGVNTATPAVYYVLSDHLFRPVKLTNASGVVAWQAIYEPFGTVSYATLGSFQETRRFPGQWFQLETGLAYNWHRHYDATIGRYVQADPIGLKGGVNRFGYVGGRPLDSIDPFGLAEIPSNVPSNIPGGPYTPAGEGQRPGTFFGPKPPSGLRQISRWVPSEAEGGPPGSEGYWKTQSPGQKGWNRFNQNGAPTSPEEAHPGRRLPNDPLLPIIRLSPWGVRSSVFFYSTPAY